MSSVKTSAPRDLRPTPKAAQELRRRLAHNVHRLRLAQKLTIDQAAGAAQIDRRHWHKVEDGEVNATLRTLLRIAAALQVRPAELFQKPARKGRG